jgi:hypothetical protein
LIPAEFIPDDADLYYRVHRDLVKPTGGKLGPNCFRDPQGLGLSTDWSKYKTPRETRLAKGVEKAINYGVTGLPVGRVRQIQQLTVVHTPNADNDAHTDIFGLSTTDDELRTMQRYELYEACGRTWLIEPGASIAA